MGVHDGWAETLFSPIVGKVRMNPLGHERVKESESRVAGGRKYLVSHSLSCLLSLQT